jgi:hypothetical protein
MIDDLALSDEIGCTPEHPINNARLYETLHRWTKNWVA